MEGDVSQSPGRNPGRRQAFWDQTAGFWGARRAGFLRGCITDRHFFAGRYAAFEGRNDGALPCSHAMAAGPVCPCGEMKETVCNRA